MLHTLFEAQNMEVCEAENGADGVQKAQALHPSLVILDLSMPLMNGLEAARALKSTMPQVPLLMFTNNAGAAADEARQAGIFAMVSKSDANSSQQLVAYAKLELHPHVHCVVAAGGLSLDRTHWIQPRYPFFLPVKVLSRVFRGKFVFALKRNFRQGKLGFYGNLKPLAHPKAFSAWIRTLFRNDWHVYSKRPFGGAKHALCYLGHYTHRVAISNHRLVSLANDQVTFRWRDSAHHNEHKLMTLALDEFLRRFLLHTLPKGFVRIRHFGFLANRRRATLLPLCYQLLGTIPQPQVEQQTSAAKEPRPLWRCPKCGGPMVVLERLSAAQLQLRSPPRLAGVAA